MSRRPSLWPCSKGWRRKRWPRPRSPPPCANSSPRAARTTPKPPPCASPSARRRENSPWRRGSSLAPYLTSPPPPDIAAVERRFLKKRPAEEKAHSVPRDRRRQDRGRSGGPLLRDG